jgi:peroxiredoxin
LRSIQKSLDQFSAVGIRPVAISADTPEESRDLCRKAGYTFTFLADPDLEAIKRYDLVHQGQGEKGRDIARPGEFLVDTNGVVRWRMLTENFWVRARPEQILEAAKTLP